MELDTGKLSYMEIETETTVKFMVYIMENYEDIYGQNRNLKFLPSARIVFKSHIGVWKRMVLVKDLKLKR